MSSAERGTQYGANAIDAYAKFAHGADMALFLDPFIQSDLDKQRGKKILDAGCGAAPWSIYAAEHGASEVHAIDLQDGMVDKAKQAIKAAGVEKQVKAFVGDATDLTTYQNKTFDHAISINVGCNLPTEIFNRHFDEMARTINNKGTLTVAVPDSLDTVFTDGTKEDAEVMETIGNVLEALPENPEPSLIQSSLDQLKEIVSATFTMQRDRLVLVEDQRNLKSGQKIWRKLAKVTIPNHYHSEEEYLQAFSNAHLKVANISRGTFTNSEARESVNAYSQTHPKLGPTYESHSPFVVYHLEKNRTKTWACTLL
ncbi:MAG TPA: class I SAM-dependent methyltransferase [Rhabdochlamydiaceae bacterium]|nr:class I SAM-dependent methyltransferase [Rhabdochlamydiaceae bacterium]